MADIWNEFKSLLAQVDTKIANKLNPPEPLDAIDMTLASQPRKTATESIANSPEVAEFETKYVDGLIANDAGRQLLALVNNILTQMVFKI